MRIDPKLVCLCMALVASATWVRQAAGGDQSGSAVVVRPASERIDRVERNQGTGELRVLGSPLITHIAIAHGLHPLDVLDAEVELPRGALLDVYVRPSDGKLETAEQLMREHLAARYGYVATPVVRNKHSAVLRQLEGWPPLEPSAADATLEQAPGRFAATGVPISSLIRFVRSIAGQPVVDETGLRERYDMVLEWDTSSQPLALVQAFADIGLEMIFERRDITFLVLGKAP